MNDVQENKLSMYLAIKTVLMDNDSIWTGFPAFVSAVVDFGEKLEGIILAVERQETAITGVRSDKLVAQELMITSALAVSGSVFAYASATNNQTLKEAVNYSYSSLRYVRDTISAERCKIIHSQALAEVANLADYGITAATLTELDELIDSFADLLPAPRVAITSRKGATSGLVDLIKDIDLILNERLDMLMPQFKESNLEFYKHYFDSRLIAGARRSSDDGDGGDGDDGETGEGNEI